MKKTKLYKLLGCFGLALLLSLLFIKVDSQAAYKRTTTLDITSYNYDTSLIMEGWTWNYSTRTLTLTDVDFEVADDYAIVLPRENCTIIVNGYNVVKSDYAAISCVVGPEYENNHIGTLTVSGAGTLNLTAGSKGFQYEGDMVVQNLNLTFTGSWLFNFVSNLTIDKAYINATGTGSSFDPEYALIGTLDEDQNKASLVLKNCYVDKGGAVLKDSAYCYFIGTAYNKGAKDIVINRGNAPKTVGKIATKYLKFTKDYKKLALRWNVPRYSSGKFEVWRSTKKGSGYKKIATVYKPFYQDKKLTFQKKYYYKIKAYTQGTKKTSMSGYKAVTTGLASVVDFHYVYGAAKDELRWSKVYGAQGYIIYRATSAKGKYSPIRTITKGSTLNYTVKRPKKSKTYYYKIRAYRKIGSKKYFSGYTKAYEDDPPEGMEDD